MICKKLERVENLQRLYNEGKIMSDEAFEHITSFIKSRLRADLIKNGYYKNGERQSNFGYDEILDCYVFVMSRLTGTFVKMNGEKTHVKYNPNRANVATFIYTWIRGYCNSIRKKQKKELDLNVHKIYTLDDGLLELQHEELIEEGNFEELEEMIDFESFLDTSQVSFDEPDSDLLLCDFIQEHLLEGLEKYLEVA
jgi:hypothetical protein